MWSVAVRVGIDIWCIDAITRIYDLLRQINAALTATDNMGSVTVQAFSVTCRQGTGLQTGGGSTTPPFTIWSTIFGAPVCHVLLANCDDQQQTEIGQFLLVV